MGWVFEYTLGRLFVGHFPRVLYSVRVQYYTFYTENKGSTHVERTPMTVKSNHTVELWHHACIRLWKIYHNDCFKSWRLENSINLVRLVSSSYRYDLSWKNNTGLQKNVFFFSTDWSNFEIIDKMSTNIIIVFSACVCNMFLVTYFHIW